MEIVPDPILILVQAAPFLVTLLALNFIIFQPMLAFLQEREGVSAGGWQEARALEASIHEKMALYEAQLATARADVVELLAARRAEAAADYEELVADARTDADHQVKQAIARIQAERDTASAALSEGSRALAEQIAGRVLGRDLAGSAA